MGFLLMTVVVVTLLFHQAHCYNSPAKFFEEKAGILGITDPPSLVSNKSTAVEMGIYINSFDSTNFGKDMSITLNMYIRMQWIDPRFAYDKEEFGSQITLPDGAWENVWIPDTFIRNEISSQTHTMSRENVLFKVNPEGQFWFVRQLTVRLNCPMKLQEYPFDVQSCSVILETFRYKMETCTYGWQDSRVEIDPAVEIPEARLIKTVIYDCTQNYPGGSFTCLEISFVMRRDVGFFVKIYYLPTVLLVMLSWCSFWMNCSTHFPQRILFLTLLMMALLSLQFYVVSLIARVPYITAIESWSTLCQIFVLGAILQAITVKTIGDGIGITAQKDATSSTGEDRNCCGKQYNPSTVCKLVELISKIVFPCVFLLGVFIYFPLYSQTV